MGDTEPRSGWKTVQLSTIINSLSIGYNIPDSYR